MTIADFITLEQGPIPQISLFWFTVMMVVMLLLIGLTIRYHKSVLYTRTFKGLQAIQLLALYAWYIAFSIPASNSLPLYHCRLAMFALLFLKDKTKLKQYFALMGVSGAILALVYPVLDPYTFPHITGLSFLLGHYALLVNGLAYLLNHYQASLLSSRLIIGYTFVLNLCLLGVNQLTGGNYGLLKNTPFITDQSLLVRYLAVSICLSLTLLAIDYLMRYRESLTDKRRSRD